MCLSQLDIERTGCTDRFCFALLFVVYLLEFKFGLSQGIHCSLQALLRLGQQLTGTGQFGLFTLLLSSNGCDSGVITFQSQCARRLRETFQVSGNATFVCFKRKPVSSQLRDFSLKLRYSFFPRLSLTDSSGSLQKRSFLPLLLCLFTSKVLFFPGRKELHAVKLQSQHFQLFALFGCALMYLDGKLTINRGAGDLLQNRRTLIGCCLEKGCKTTLRQQHRTGETIKIHPGDVFHFFCNGGELGFKNSPAFGQGDLVFW